MTATSTLVERVARRVRSVLSPLLPASIRPLVTRARGLVARSPAPVADRITDLARSARHRQREHDRAAHPDDAAYFDHLVADAIGSATEARR